MPQYTILNEEVQDKGSVFEVVLQTDEGYSETQKYFVSVGESKEIILSKAAWHLQDSLTSHKEEEKPIVEVQALPKEQLN